VKLRKREKKVHSGFGGFFFPQNSQKFLSPLFFSVFVKLKP